MAIPRMRTAAKVLEEIKKLDPDTELSLHYVRMMIRDEVVPVFCIGNKKLVNVDDVITYLETGVPVPAKEPAPDGGIGCGKIRRVV